MRRDDDTPDAIAIAVMGAASATVTVWLGATLALLVAGHPAVIPPSAAVEALAGLGSEPAQPSDAWPSAIARHLPGPLVYWASTALGAVLLALATLLVLRGGRHRVGSRPRRPLGADSRAAFASRRDLRRLLIWSEQPGRFVIGRMGRALVATEPPRHIQSGRGARRTRGDCGAVAIVGPSRSGKSVAVIGGILQWDGPAVIASVKADLLDVTRQWRATLGSVRVYDPTGTTMDPRHSARWSPLQHAQTTLGAQRAARALCDAGHHGGTDAGLDYWLAQAEILLSGLLYVAANTGGDMATVCDWVLLQDRPTDDAPGQVQTAINDLLESSEPSIRSGTSAALKALTAIWSLDHRARSAAYSTTQTLIWPWAEPTVAASAKYDTGDAPTDLTWVLDGANSLYLCSPIEDQNRLAPAIGGLLNDIINQAYRHVSATGQPLDPPLLIVIDEAGNTPLRALPEYASTLAGIGIVLVTVWQSLAQIEARYGPQADTILTNHLTKCFFPGLSDPTSVRYIDGVLGQTEVPSISRSTQVRPSSRAVQESTSVQSLTPPHALRQMRQGTALVLHGTVPPAHIAVAPFYSQRGLRHRVEGLRWRSGPANCPLPTSGTSFYDRLP